MKVLIILTFLLTGCSNMKYNIPNYIGEMPYYAIQKPHGKQCPCCQLHRVGEKCSYIK